ncbi:protein kinase domain-containing protein [Nonomuraea salmonea]|uniref:protein kinase domain-containing protein n=1 Tax=Nonomuraea salmonea TaxID=46181 RepID=UPI002FE70975
MYRARSVATMADVLVKTLACHRVDKRALKRIIRGFAFPDELAAHDGVIPVLEVGATGDGRPYLVTPPHDGLTLAERPDRDRPMPVEQVAGLLAAVARAVAATHAAGGVHGRVTPSNVVMTPNGVMLTGFAMSALMSIAELPDGTPPSVHASPEELEGRPPVAASDVYSLASTTYELLTGHPAFPLEGATNTARFTLAVLTEPPPHPYLPQSLRPWPPSSRKPSPRTPPPAPQPPPLPPPPTVSPAALRDLTPPALPPPGRAPRPAATPPAGRPRRLCRRPACRHPAPARVRITGQPGAVGAQGAGVDRGLRAVSGQAAGGASAVPAAAARARLVRPGAGCPGAGHRGRRAAGGGCRWSWRACQCWPCWPARAVWRWR